MANLDFCTNCHKWIAANEGQMRRGPDNEPEIICDECLALEQGQAVLLAHGAKSGSLDDG